MIKKRCILSILLIIVLTLVSTSSVFAVPNKVFANTSIFLDIKNSSFENTITDEFDKPFVSDWVINGENFVSDNVNVVSTSAYEGRNSLQLKNGVFNIESKEFIEIENSAQYLFGVKFVFSDVDDSLQISVKTYNSQNEIIATHKSQTIISKQENLDKWQEAFLMVDKDANAKKVKISIEVDSKKGSVGVDNVYGYKNFVNLYNGASISLEKNIVQIRFTAKIDIDVYQTFINNYSFVSVGMLLSPKEQVDKVGEFTVKGIPENGKMAMISASNWNNPNSYMKDGYYTFCAGFGQHGYGGLENIINGEIVVRAYVKYTENGKENIIYSSWNLNDNCRSIRQVANSAKQDIEVYNSYSLDQQEIISAYIEGRTPNVEGLD